jgi:phosphotransferase system IIB component
MPTWTKDVETVLTRLGGTANVIDIAEKMKGIRFFISNTDVKGSVRVTLNNNKEMFKSVGSGKWRLINCS